MEIHQPEGPTHSFKDFAIHIGIVTLGILIALGLEGIRESLHDHALLREARANFRSEINEDHRHMTIELANTANVSKTIDADLADLPTLAHDPAQLKKRVDAIQPSFYYVSSSSWTSALSSGALAHMNTEEVDRYASFNGGTVAYTSLQQQILPMYLDFESYVQSRKTFGPTEVDEIQRRLLLFKMYAHILTHVGEQYDRTLLEVLHR